MITQLDIRKTDDQLKSMATIYDDTHTAKYSPIVVISKEDTKNDGYISMLSYSNNSIVIASTTEYVNKFIFSPIVNPIKNSIKNHINMLMLLNFGILTVTAKYVRA